MFLEKAPDASRTEGSTSSLIMKRCEVRTCSGHSAAWSGGGVEYIKQ